MWISRQEFEQLVREAIAGIPLEFRRRLENVDFALEDGPTPDIRSQLRLGSSSELLGLYQGVPITRRGADYGNVLPDKITLYPETIAAACPDRTALKREIRRVVLHEVGHYFGLSDETLRRLERQAGRDEEAEP